MGASLNTAGITCADSSFPISGSPVTWKTSGAIFTDGMERVSSPEPRSKGMTNAFSKTVHGKVLVAALVGVTALVPLRYSMAVAT